MSFVELTTGSEYYYCVDEITEDLKVPRFSLCFLTKLLFSSNCAVWAE